MARKKRYSWSRAIRLRRRSDFQRLILDGHRFRTRFFNVWWLNREDDEAPRFGIRVSRRVSRRAVVRNRLRRRLREILRYHQYAIRGVDLILSAKPGAEGASYRDLENDIRSILEKINEVKNYVPRTSFTEGKGNP